jgi:hypothetical protein
MHEWWQRMCSVLLGVTLGGCATVTTPATWQPGNVQPLISGWQQYFGILWSVTRQDQDSLIEGYITNNWGFAVREVQVLVNGYDSSGAQTGQVIAWDPNAIQPGDRVYFDVTVPAGAATYDVSVYAPAIGHPARLTGREEVRDIGGMSAFVVVIPCGPAGAYAAWRR